VTRSVADLMDLTGRAALVTGGTGHIGLSACEALLELGSNVAVLDIDAYACQERANDLRRIGKGNPVAVPCDLKDESETRRSIQKVVQELGRLDILIHCAAYVGTTEVAGWSVPFEQQTVDAWDAAMRVNVTSAFIMVQEAKDALAYSGHGSVILFGSIYGIAGPDFGLYAGTDMANPAAYGASKGGVIQLTRYLATVLAPQVRVNSISPGGVARCQPSQFQERYVKKTPLARMATEEDLKGAIAYLASDLSAYVTGHNLVVDGGWTTW
jgi:NAD(P)-dependent dehydrogenase (short-subunit alcohol dehydrogenase family)